MVDLHEILRFRFILIEAIPTQGELDPPGLLFALFVMQSFGISATLQEADRRE
jgi:hypothetical protein